jgi:hypothetical protein
MKFYVPVGAGGTLFRVGSIVTGLLGSVVYWRASLRRGTTRNSEVPTTLAFPTTEVRRTKWSLEPTRRRVAISRD